MDGYVKVYDWMLELELKPAEILAFAVIFSFGKDGEWFQGSASYLGKWMGVTRKHTIYDALSSLVAKGLLEKRERWEKGQKLCDYRPGRKAHQAGAKSSPGPGAKSVLHNNRPDSNRDNSKEINNKERVTMSPEDFHRKHRK
jgi:hypothetical protein